MSGLSIIYIYKIFIIYDKQKIINNEMDFIKTEFKCSLDIKYLISKFILVEDPGVFYKRNMKITC